ncbi:hypothetical protein LIER_03154 [Lithospermum erythrorhizon]|uniref:Uncharacterized protein n=1 Tax=Lithospermum erythrorhizon TaxID=34254 RepID=A0AAV3NS44_LITER
MVLCNFLNLSLSGSFDFPLLLFQTASASWALEDGHAMLYQQTLDLNEELAQERLQVEALEQKLQGLRLQVSNHPWDLTLLDQDIRRPQEERDAADRAARVSRQEKEGLRRVYI